jgi:MerR family transcriptional regulator, repressor of the yfmOP operon
MKDESKVYQIGEVAELTGLSQRALRYYEELGLLEPRSHGPGKFRIYSEGDLERLRRIKRLKDNLGFSLQQAKEAMERDDQRKRLMEMAANEKSREKRRKALEGARKILLEETSMVKERQDKLKELERLLRQRIQEVDDELTRL